MTGIPPPAGGLVANIASFFADSGAGTRGFEVELEEVSSGGCRSLISRDFIPVDRSGLPRRQPSGGIIAAPHEKLCRFFIEDRNFMVQDRVNEHLLLCKPSSPMYAEGLL